MTSGLFWISYAAAWVLLLALSGAVLVLFRFSVRAYRTQTPSGLGDVGTMNGPALDASPPIMEVERLTGEPVAIGRATGTAQLIVFARSGCTKCKIALEVLHSFASQHPELEAIVVCGGDPAAIMDCASFVESPLTALADPRWRGARTWQVASMPFGVVLDAAGVVRARGDPTSGAMLTVLSWHLERGNDDSLLRGIGHAG